MQLATTLRTLSLFLGKMREDRCVFVAFAALSRVVRLAGVSRASHGRRRRAGVFPHAHHPAPRARHQPGNGDGARLDRRCVGRHRRRWPTLTRPEPRCPRSIRLPVCAGNLTANRPLRSNLDSRSRILFRLLISSRPQSCGSPPVRVVRFGQPMVLSHMSQGRPSDLARCRAYPHGRGLIVVLAVPWAPSDLIPMVTPAPTSASRRSTTQTRRQR